MSLSHRLALSDVFNSLKGQLSLIFSRQIRLAEFLPGSKFDLHMQHYQDILT